MLLYDYIHSIFLSWIVFLNYVTLLDSPLWFIIMTAVYCQSVSSQILSNFQKIKFDSQNPNLMLYWSAIMFHGDRYSGVSTDWQLVPYFSMLMRIQFSRLTVVLSVTGRYKVYASYACLDPGIQIIEFLLPLIQTLPPLEKEKAHEVRLDGFLPPTLLSATSLARCPWSGQ